MVKEFTDACRKNGIVPFFYHTLLDWREKSYTENFSEYLKYLRKSVEILCSKYGEIGGFWFDGKWDKPDSDWQEDELYATIRRHQPNAIIINNTGLSARGALGHIELDSVTFERGRPEPLNQADAPKYIASEMCQTIGDVWGYGENDLHTKSPTELIEDLCVCRKCGSNFLLNVGPTASGYLRPLDAEIFKCIGKWVSVYDVAIRAPRPCNAALLGAENDFILRDGNRYYAFLHGLGMNGDANVVEETDRLNVKIALDGNIKSARWLDNGKAVKISRDRNGVYLTAEPFDYGTNLIVRVAEIETE